MLGVRFLAFHESSEVGSRVRTERTHLLVQVIVGVLALHGLRRLFLFAP